MSDWRDLAACHGMNPELWFPPPQHAGGYHEARRVCDTCTVKVECLDEAMVFERDAGKAYRAGMYGGLTANQRYELSHGRLKARRVSCAVCSRRFDPGVRGRLCCSELCRDVRAVDRARERTARRRGKRRAA